jgi:hypothetical protein
MFNLFSHITKKIKSDPQKAISKIDLEDRDVSKALRLTSHRRSKEGP